jgi:hypothetical protein
MLPLKLSQRLLKKFSGQMLSVTRYCFGLLVATGSALALVISAIIVTELSEQNLNAANKVFTPEETRGIVSFTSPEVSGPE